MLAIAAPRRWALLVCAAGVAALSAGRPAIAQQQIGVNAAVNPDVTGNPPPGAAMRRLVIGQNVVFNEHIVTAAAGQTQILFVDESSMTVGPNSDMMIDQFVYDPQAGTGRMLTSVTKGVFRLVGGRLSKQPNAIQLRTPAATIGIRGGVALGEVTPPGRLEIIFVFGDWLDVTGTTGIASRIARQGFEVIVAGPGAAPSAPFRAPPGEIARLLAAVNGRPGGTGGVARIPTDADVLQSGIENQISGNLPASIAAAERATPIGAPPALDVAALATAEEQQIVSSQTQPVIVASIRRGAHPGPIGPPTPPTPPIPPGPKATGLSGGLYSTDHTGTALGFTAPATQYTGGEILSDNTFTATVGGSPVSIPLAASFGPSGTTPLGPVTGTAFVSPDNTFFFADLTPVSFPDQREFIYGGTPVNPAFYQPTGKERFFAFNVQPDAALQSGIPFLRPGTGGDLPNATVSQLYMTAPADASFAGPVSGGTTGKALQASLAINGSGAGQSSVIVVMVGNPVATGAQPSLVGQLAGSFRASGTSSPISVTSNYSSAVDSTGTSFYGGNQIAGFVVTGSPTETVVPGTSGTAYNFVQPATAGTLPAGVGSSVSTRTLTGFFGGIMTREAPGGALPYVLTGSTSISTDASLLQLAGTFTGADPFTAAASGTRAMVLQYGSLTPGSFGGQAFIDDNLFAALQSPTAPTTVNGGFASASTFMVSSAVVPSTALLPAGVSFCACQFLEWGYWGGEVDSAAPGGGTRVDYGHINTWVAGLPTPAADLANLQSMGATASYSGAAVGSVSNSGAQYLAAGGFNGSYNFGTQSGSIAISNFDGRNFGGAVSGKGGMYSGALAGSGLTGAANGGFYGPNAIETGGSFAVNGGGYSAAGIFTGRQP